MTKDEIKKALKCCSNPSISYCKDCPYANCGKFDCCNGKMCKDALNLITEQENEIERLRTTLGQCNTELNSALESLKSQCREIGALKAGTKQAKIDVLNRLKQIYGYYSCYSLGNDVRSLNVIIDEIIKEVQNE